jgi:methylated-DNA-[protein]-cysteine S-methyltransferase
MSVDGMRSWSTYASPFGTLTLTATGRGLDGLFFPGRAPVLDDSRQNAEAFTEATRQLDEYFACGRRRFELPLDLSAGTPFQRAVWRQLEMIPYGETRSYTELAAQVGLTGRVRAVGAAVGRNRMPIVVACHRVIAADGSLTGYLGGLQRKQALLDTEQAVLHGDGQATGFGPRQLALLD